MFCRVEQTFQNSFRSPTKLEEGYRDFSYVFCPFLPTGSPAINIPQLQSDPLVTKHISSLLTPHPKPMVSVRVHSRFCTFCSLENVWRCVSGDPSTHLYFHKTLKHWPYGLHPLFSQMEIDGNNEAVSVRNLYFSYSSTTSTPTPYKFFFPSALLVPSGPYNVCYDHTINPQAHPFLMVLRMGPLIHSFLYCSATGWLCGSWDRGEEEFRLTIAVVPRLYGSSLNVAIPLLSRPYWAYY